MSTTALRTGQAPPRFTVPARPAPRLSPRIAWLAGGRERPSAADIFRHYRSYIMVGLLGFRGLSSIAPMVILAGAYGVGGPIAWLTGVWAVAVAANFTVILLLLRRWELTPRRVTPWLVVDLAVAVGLNLWGAWIVPGSVNDPYHDLFFFWYLGTVLLWCAWYGSRAGLILSLAAVPLQIAMTVLSGDESVAETLPMLVGRTAWLLAGTYTGSLIFWVLRVATDGVHAEGVRTGRQAAQVQDLRHLRDTALQTLEAIGLTAENDRMEMGRRLELIGTAARSQASDIRSALTDDCDEPYQDALEEVGEVVSALRPRLAAAGVRATFTNRYGGRMELHSTPVRALSRAVHEALGNVVKHSGAAAVVVEAAVHGDRVEVTVRDDGTGFDAGRQEGFGIRHSLRGRLAEVGGGARIGSAPGRGTSVSLWVPR